MIKIKSRLITPNVGENMEQPEFSYMPGKSISGITTLINGLTTSCKVEHMSTQQFQPYMHKQEKWNSYVYKIFVQKRSQFYSYQPQLEIAQTVPINK